MGFQFISSSDAEDSLSPDALSPSCVFCYRGVTEDGEDVGKAVLSSMATGAASTQGNVAEFIKIRGLPRWH